MATIGNMSAVQVRMAQVSAKYGAASSNLFSGLNSSKTSSNDEVLAAVVKNKNAYVKQRYNELYKSVFGTTEEEVQSKTALKTSSAQTNASAQALTDFANGLKYGGEFDSEQYTKAAEDFAKNYNSMIEGLGEAQGESLLQKGVIMVNTAKVYSGALKRAGFTVGSDNKLTFDKNAKVTATDIKSTFGNGGFTSKVSQKAQQIGSLSASQGLFSYTAASTQNYAYTIGALFSTYA